MHSHRHPIRMTVAVLATVLLALAAPAAPTDEAKGLLDKLTKLFDRAPLRINWTMEINVPIGEGTMASTGQGEQLYADPNHQKLDLSMTMSSPQGEMKMTMKSVYDGSAMWTEMAMPKMGMRQVSRASLDVVHSLGEAAQEAQSMDPRAMIERLFRVVQFEVVGRDEGKITLEGPLTAEVAKSLNFGSAPGMDLTDARIRLSLDSGNGQPREMSVLSGGSPLISMHYGDIEFVDRDSLPAGTFSYSPPDGIQVNDMDEMLKKMAAKDGE